MTLPREDPFVDNVTTFVITRGGERVKEINETTKSEIQRAIQRTIAAASRERDEDGNHVIPGPAELADRMTEAVGSLSVWNEARAETIARTETMFAYNDAALASYREYGVTQVQAIDGDVDAECAERDGQVFDLEEAMNIIDHPNGTLDWLPVIGEAPAEPAAPEPAPTAPTPAPVEKPKPTRFTQDDIRRAQEANAARQRAQLLEEAAARTAATPARTTSQSAVDLIATQPVKPVSSAFDTVIGQVESHPIALKDPQYRKVLDKIKSALGTIDDTFKDGNLPDMPFIGPIKGGNSALQGAYKHGVMGLRSPISLEFRANAHLETVFHEITHFIDQHGLGFNGGFASKWGFARARGELDSLLATIRTSIQTETSLGRLAEVKRLEQSLVEIEARAEVMEPVAQAIINSRGYTALTEGLANGEIRYLSQQLTSTTLRLDRRTISWISYARAPEEAFARAMAQYLAKRAGPNAIRDLESRLYVESPTGSGFLTDAFGRRVVKPLADQWDWDDFRDIDRALDEMFRKIGWGV